METEEEWIGWVAARYVWGEWEEVRDGKLQSGCQINKFNKRKKDIV